MKRKFYIVLCMMVCVNGMFAQTSESNVDQDTTEVSPPAHPEVEPADSNNDMKELIHLLRAFHENALAEQQLAKPDYTKQYVPAYGKGFWRKHQITQRLEISILGGADDQEDPDDNQDYADDLRSGDESNDTHGTHFGFNVGYSLVFVPGKLEGDQLRLNRFGFGYSLGFIASVDHQDKYNTTCDILSKIGIEAGNHHAMGIGVDFLIGTGTSAVTAVFEEMGANGNDLYGYDTEWCLKYGFQLWVRSNLLHANIKNTDVRLFARYVHSKDPTNDNDFVVEGKELGYYLWSPDSWQFGLTFCYDF